MITRIALKNVATFTDPSKAVIMPKKINFFFGGNGSGKTTLSQAIVDSPGMILWENEPLQTLVYNRLFVESNFAETGKIKGVFTLGQDSREAKDAIAELRSKNEQIRTQITSHARSQKQLEAEQQQLTTQIEESCWRVKGQYDTMFAEAFKGVKKRKSDFRERCFQEVEKEQTVLPDIETIKRTYSLAFGEARSEHPKYQLIDIATLEPQEAGDLLQQRITGSSDTPVGKFIEFLSNSDWIKQGLAYAAKADGKCPFCQQAMSAGIEGDIRAFFDESYERDVRRLSEFADDYGRYANRILSWLQSCSDSPLQLLNYDQLNIEVTSLRTLIENNVVKLQRKITAPSEVVAIASLRPILERINSIFSGFNMQIEESNTFSRNQKAKQNECVDEVWQLVVSQLRTEIANYNRDYSAKAQGIAGIKAKIDSLTAEHEANNLVINEKQKTLTSIEPTATAINAILTKFGFEGFSVAENQNDPGTYMIIRPDGREAQRTLSEGEYNFITFLYFYHLVYGSQEQSGIDKPKIVVVDDPISSLDSNVLFIVSTLVKQIRDDCRNGKHGIKQIFIMTHNVFFHKEATFLGSRFEWKNDEVAFWLIQKYNNVSRVVGFDRENPVKSSYQMLWSDIINNQRQPNVSIFNAMRRILEHYFNLIGGLDYEQCINDFEGEDKLVCKSLVSCINEGSHMISDDYHLPLDNESISNLLRVFKLIFEKMGHSSHYEMMMRPLP